MTSVIANTTEQRQAAHAILTKIIADGGLRAAQGLEALQEEYRLRQDLRVRPTAIDIDMEKTEGGQFVWRPAVIDSRKGTRTALGVTTHARAQLLSRAGIPATFANTLAEHDLGELLRENLKNLLPKVSPDTMLVRTVNGTAKAFLSSSYRCLDNAILFESYVEQAMAAKLVPYRGDVSDTRAFLSFLRPEIVELTPGEFVVFGVEMRGSDYGRGAQELNTMILRLLCLNGAVGFDLFRKVHIGRRFDASQLGDDNVIQVSHKTLALDTATVRSALTDTMRGVTKQLDAMAETMRDQASDDVNVPATLATLKKKGFKAEVVKKVQATYENEALPVEVLPQSPGAWRLSNAISLLANSARDTDEAADLRDAAFQVLNLKAAA